MTAADENKMYRKNDTIRTSRTDVTMGYATFCHLRKKNLMHHQKKKLISS